MAGLFFGEMRWLSFAVWWRNIGVGDVKPFFPGKFDLDTLDFRSLVERRSNFVENNVLLGIGYQPAAPDSWSISSEDWFVTFHSRGVVAFGEL